MAYEFLTLLDIAKLNGSDMAIGLIEENLNAAPEIGVLPARMIKGTSFKSLVRTAYPVGGFRKVNEGTEPTKSSYINRQHETFYYDGQMEMDAAAASADERGPAHALSLEADGHGQSFLLTAGKQTWYGNTAGGSGDVDGFPGASQIVDSSLLVDATGSTANTGSSVYALVAVPKFMGLILGNNTVMEVGEWRKQSITRNSKEMTAWKNSIEGWIGVEWLNKYAVGRIKNLTAQVGKGLTDLLLADLFAGFPVGIKPTHLFMSRRSRSQLQKARTVTLNGNAQGNPGGNQMTIAPMPTSYDGVPIIATDSILDTEAIA